MPKLKKAYLSCRNRNRFSIVTLHSSLSPLWLIFFNHHVFTKFFTKLIFRLVNACSIIFIYRSYHVRFHEIFPLKFWISRRLLLFSIFFCFLTQQSAIFSAQQFINVFSLLLQKLIIFFSKSAKTRKTNKKTSSYQN